MKSMFHAVSVAFLAAPLLLSACGTATIDDAVPRAARAGDRDGDTRSGRDDAEFLADADAAAFNAAGGDDRPRRRGRYPNLNIKPAAAAEQISDDRRDEIIRELEKMRFEDPDEQEPARSDSRRLEEIGRTHGDSVLDTIERRQREEE